MVFGNTNDTSCNADGNRLNLNWNEGRLNCDNWNWNDDDRNSNLTVYAVMVQKNYLRLVI